MKELVRRSIGECQVSLKPCHLNCIFASIFHGSILFSLSLSQELKRFPSLQTTIAAAAGEALEKFRDESRKTVIRLVDMESSYLTVDFFRRLPQEMERGAEKGGNPPGGNAAAAAAANMDRYVDGHFRRIGSNVSSYVNMVSETLKNTIPKAVVYCQVREAKQSLLNYFYTQIGKTEVFIWSPCLFHYINCSLYVLRFRNDACSLFSFSPKIRSEYFLCPNNLFPTSQPLKTNSEDQLI